MNSEYSKIVLCLGTMIFLSVNGLCQWSQNFDSDDLSDWGGDVDQFIINEDNELQLNAPDAGEAFIFRNSSISFDSISFSFYHKMDFAPSDNNKSIIYLALDNQDESVANGYYIEIGENGNTDALKFYYLESGTSSLIASAAMGMMASEPATVKLEIDIFPNGLWSVKTNYQDEDFTSLDIEFLDDRFSFSESLYFGLNCKFSASRSDKFFFDDFEVKPFEKDQSPPEVNKVEALSINSIKLTFSEPVLKSDALDQNKYLLDNEIGIPKLVSELGSLGNVYILSFEREFDASLNYRLNVGGIHDLNQNVLSNQDVPFSFAASPLIGDLYLSEILFDPYPGGEDFLEIYNASNKNIDLKGLIIRNNQREENEIIVNDIILEPGGYIALTETVDFLLQEYKPEPSARIEFQELPAFNNDQGNVMIFNKMAEVLDSFDYNEDQHFQLIDDTEGVSLERGSFEIPSTSDENWQSASENVRFGTPGYNNSNAFDFPIGEESFDMVAKTFSPNQDGDGDQMILNYQLDKSNYVVNISIHNAAGFKIRDLSQNELLSTKGIITWDGTTNDGQIADLGIYVVIGKAFHASGDVKTFKLTTVLADFVD